MTIDISILTTTPAILDADGRTGVGTIRIRPNQPFQYNDGVTDIQVTDASVEIAVSGGKLQSALTLAPNTGASNVPSSTYYIVKVDINTITYTEYWRLANTPTSLEWGDITRLANPEDAGGDLLTAHIQASNPHRQYLLRSDTVSAATAGTVSDGLGAIPRCDPVTGTLPASFMPSTYDAFPTGTRLLFQQTAAPTGWTKDSTAAYNNAMMVGTTGSVASGGSADATTWLSGHVHPIAHTHEVSMPHTHDVTITHTHDVSGGALFTAGLDGIAALSGSTTTGASDATHTTGAGSDTTVTSGGVSAANSTGPTTSPKYFTAIIASKD